MVSWFGMVREIYGDTGNTKTFLHNNSSAATGGKKKKKIWQGNEMGRESRREPPGVF